MSYYSHNLDPILDPLRCLVCKVEATEGAKGRRVGDDEWLCPEHKHLCAACGGEKEEAEPFHCDECYARLFPSIFDYDDD